MKASLTVRVERLERVVDEELLKREKSEKYTHNMLEDLKTQMRAGFDNDKVTDRLLEERIAAQLAARDSRLSRMELAMATALGGLIVIAWLINHAADSIMRLLAASPIK